MDAFRRFVRELRRRSLWQVLGIYLVGAWLGYEIVVNLTEGLRLPDWFPALAVVLFIVGLPLVMATAFVREGAGAEAVPEAATGGARAGPASGGTAVAPGRVRLLTWRNVVGGGIGVFALWGVVAAVWLALRGPPSDEAPVPDLPMVSRSVIAVLPFSVRSGPDFQYLGAGVVSLLSTKLDGAGELRSVDSRALLGHVEREGWQTGDPDHGRAIARRFGAGLFVLGDVVEAGGRLQVSASLYETSGEGGAVAEGSAEGQDVFELIDHVAAQLLAGVEGGPGARVRRIAGVTTSSLSAFRAYLEGENEFRQGRFEPAMQAFQRAVDEDTLYALAYYRLSVAAEWLTRTEVALAAAESAFRYAGRLSERDRRLLEAFLAWHRGAYDEAERRYRSLVSTYPTDVEGWFQLGEIQFHSNPLRGRSIAESREAFERVLSFEPDDATSIIHLVRISAIEGRLDDADSLTARYLAVNPSGDRIYEMRAMQAFAHEDRARQDSILAELAMAPDLAGAQAYWIAGTFTRNIEGTERLARLLTDERRFSREVWTNGHAAVTHTLLARGRWREARRELEKMAVHDPVSATEYRAFTALLPLYPVEPDTLRALRQEVERIDPESVRPSENPSFFYNVHDNLHGVIRSYLAGMLSARLGDPSAAMRYAAELERMASPRESGSLTSDLAASVRAQVAIAEGRFEDGLAALERVRQEIFYNWTLASPYYAETLERFTRAELLRELGRGEEALGWYAHIGEVAPFEFPYLPAAYLQQARIYEGLGRSAEAAAHYARFVELWRDADPELQPVVDEARAAMRRLVPDG